MSRSASPRSLEEEEEDAINVDKCDSDDDEPKTNSEVLNSSAKTESMSVPSSISSSKSGIPEPSLGGPPRRSFFITDILSDANKSSGSLSAFKPLRVPTKYFSSQTLSPTDDPFRRGLQLGQYKTHPPNGPDLGKCSESLKSDSEDDDEDDDEGKLR